MINLIATNPPHYPDTPGSLVTCDPCTDQTARQVLSMPPVKSPDGIRRCTYDTPNSRGGTITVAYGIDSDPFTLNSSSKPTTIALTDKVKSAAQWKNSVSDRCDIAWVQRQLNGGKGENVNVSYEKIQPDPGEDLCAKATTAAVAVAVKLNS